MTELEQLRAEVRRLKKALDKCHAKRLALEQKMSTAAQLGSKGGKKASANLTPEQRAERARKAAEARWGEKGKK